MQIRRVCSVFLALAVTAQTAAAVAEATVERMHNIIYLRRGGVRHRGSGCQAFFRNL